MSVVSVTANKLKDRARQWGADVVEFHNTPVPKDMQARKDKLIDRAKGVKNAIEKVFPEFSTTIPMVMDGLPLVIAGAVSVSGAAAAITYWYYEHSKFMEDLDARKDLNDQLISEGVLAPERSRIITETFGTREKQSFSGEAAKILIPVALVGGVFLLATKRR